MARAVAKEPVSQEDIENCLAWAVSQGDIVNLRFQFVSFSPLRDDSSQRVNSPKYDYLHLQDDADPAFRKAKDLLKDMLLREQIKRQLEKKGPVQLPSELLLELADNAVRLGKYSNAAQAYEMLRIRPRMRELFLEQADAALDAGEYDRAAKGYHIAANLAYDYAAFPEPLPVTAAYHKQALILHAVYPARPEDAVALLPTVAHLRAAFSFLLLDPALARRLEKRATDRQVAFLAALVRRMDAEWDAFAARYKEACGKIRSYGERLQREANEKEGVKMTIADAVEEQQDARDPREVSAALLGYAIPDGEWWQYLKELTFRHPAAALFVTRQAVTKELEIIMPRYIKDSPVITALGLHLE